MCFFKNKKNYNIKRKGVDYRCILCGTSRNKAISILNNSVLEDEGV